MNNQRRRELASVANEIACLNDVTDFGVLESIKSDIEMILMDEEMAFESMPENLQYSYRGEMSQEAQDNMNEAIDAIDEFISEYEDYETDQIHDSEDGEKEDESEIVEYLEMAAE